MIIITDHIALYPEEFYEKGLEIVTVSTLRNSPGRAESADQVAELPEQHPGQDRRMPGRLRRSLDAQPQGRSRRMHRATTSSWSSNGELLHAAHRCRDPGRHHARRRHRTGPSRRRFRCAKSPLTRHDVYIADECFLTGSAAEVIPVVKVDNRVIGDGKPGPITAIWPRRFRALMRPC